PADPVGRVVGATRDGHVEHGGAGRVRDDGPRAVGDRVEARIADLRRNGDRALELELVVAGRRQELDDRDLGLHAVDAPDVVAGIAGVADVVAVRVALAGIGDGGAVVLKVAGAVTVGIGRGDVHRAA